MTFFLGGGFPMVFITLFGAIAVAHAARFAVWPDRRRLAAIVAYGASVVFAAVAGVAVDLAAVGKNVGAAEDLAPELLTRILLIGASESMAPAILGFAVASVISLLVAAGLRRGPPPLGD